MIKGVWNLAWTVGLLLLRGTNGAHGGQEENLSVSLPVGEWITVRGESAYQGALDAANAALKRLDPYAMLYRHDSDTQVGNTRRDVFGIESIEANDRILLVPFVGSGACSKKGCEPAFLYKINGIDVKGMPKKVVLDILGRITEAHLVLEVGSGDGKDRRIWRLVKKPLVAGDLEQIEMDKSVPGMPALYLRIRGFHNRESIWNIKGYLEEMKRTGNTAVLDLRYCAGGDLFQALDTVSLFVEGGKVSAIAEAKDGTRREYRTLNGRVLDNPKPIVLVGQNTASACEVFTRAIEFYDRAVVIGRETKGKCLSQTVREVGPGIMWRFTNLKVMGPDGSECTVSRDELKLEVASGVVNDTKALLGEAAKIVGGVTKQ